MVRRSTRVRRNAVPVQGQWDILPHGMGVLATSSNQPKKQSSVIPENPEPVSINNDNVDSQLGPEKSQQKADQSLTMVASPISELQQINESTSVVEHANRDPHEVTTLQVAEQVTEEIKQESELPKLVTTLRRSKRILAQVKVDKDDNEEQEAPPKRAKKTPKGIKETKETKETKEIKEIKEIKVEGDALDSKDQQAKPKRIPRKTKDNPYGLTPGRSPFPDWQAPSAAQCEEVYRLLAEVHGEVKQPATIPAPSLEVAGCGEVPSVLDALLRTLLSGAVTFDGADNMMKAIVKEYGVVDDELAKGSISWNNVRLSTIEELEDTIRIGGLAKRKSTAIKGILDMVHQDNTDRREAYLAEKATGVPADVYGASEKTQSQKDLEILKTERDILSLDHLHGLSVDEAMKQFTKFPGIGVKTSACVILFCLQQPCFAVDTHVHRFSRWLGWAPIKADENDTFSHLEVRCPDHLKYGLHQLFIHHGKQCGRCKMSTVEGTKDWEEIVCPLEHLLVRGKRMTKVQKKPKKKAKADNTEASSHEGESEPDLSDIDEAIFGDDEYD
ncbi:DNA glycosylase [Xylaria arbuscula]|nr:DNA glycosylase [Xylaria arbuscula]